MKSKKYKAKKRKFKTPLYFVHGAWHDKWCWEENFIPFFTNLGFDVYAITLPGHDLDKNNRKINLYSIADFAKALEMELNQIPETPALIGHSMGGLVVQKFLEKNPAKAYVLLASVPPSGALHAIIRYFKKFPWPYLKGVITFNLYELVRDFKISQFLFFSHNTPDKKLEKYHGKLGNESLLAFLCMMFSGMVKKNYQMEIPGLAIAGEKDNIFSIAEQKEIMDYYKIPLKIIPDSSHDIMLDPQWETAARLIFDWMKKEIKKL